jgi:nucleotide-binding universal stress UspA family protein
LEWSDAISWVEVRGRPDPGTHDDGRRQRRTKVIRLERILFATDFSATAERAFELSLLLAREFDATLHMFHAVVLHEEDPHNPAHHFPDPEGAQRRLEELADSAMSELFERGEKTEVRIQRVKSRGISAAPTILEYANQWDADLIVIGTHGRRGPTHLLLGSVAEEVVSHAGCPVLTARGVESTASLGSVDNILVPMDFSEHSRRSLVVARELAGRFGAQVQALHVVEEMTYPAYLGARFDLSKELVDRATEALDELVKEVVGADRIQQDVVLGRRAVPEIVKFAEEKGSDLVVIATHGLGGLEEFLFGSTAKRVVQLSPAPVLALKAFGKRLLVEPPETR